MKPVFVCQLPAELQEEIRGILTRLLLFQCGSEDEAEGCFGRSLADAVQLGMDSKIVDADCAADPLKDGSYMGKKVPEDIGKDVERLAEIIAQRREMETDIPFLYQAGEKEAGIPDQRIREILDAALWDYADRMQGEELYDFLGGTLGMTDEEIKAFGFCFTEEEMGRESEEQ